MARKVFPWMNYILIGIHACFFCCNYYASENFFEIFVLNGWSIGGIIGHMWIHNGVFHVWGNLILLWVFGNAICSNIGNIPYLVFYVSGGMLAAIGHILFDGRPAIGASGAINALIMAFCMLFPFRNIRTAMILVVVPIYFFSISGLWYIPIKISSEFIYSLFFSHNVSYAMHFSGIAGGALLACLLKKLKLVNPETSDKDFYKSLGSETV